MHKPMSRIARTMGLGMFFLGPAIAGATDRDCASLTALVIPNTQFTSAEVVPAGGDLPEHCLVVGVVRPAVGFEVRLPTEWNGKLYFAGNFVFAGSLGDASPGLTRGYATASTDGGHQGDLFDASWALDNRPAEIDFGYRAVHVTAAVSRAKAWARMIRWRWPPAPSRQTSG